MLLYADVLCNVPFKGGDKCRQAASEASVPWMKQNSGKAGGNSPELPPYRLERADQLLDARLRERDVGQGAGEVGVVRGQVEQAVTAQVEENGRRLATIARLDGFVDDGADRVGGLRRWNRPLGPRKLYRSVKDTALRVGDALDVAMIDECRHQRRHTVVAQTTSMDAVRNEVVAQRVHLDERL